MSDLILKNETSVHPVTYLKNYQVPAYLIDEVNLHIDLQDEGTTVSAQMKVRRNVNSKGPTKNLKLNGEKLTLVSVAMDGATLPEDRYQLTDTSLTICNVPAQFELTIVTLIYPENNTELTGLYRSKNKYCTQCEAEGFRRITYFLDRPDVLARYTTTITADVSYPYLLSNGNLAAQGKLDGNRHFAKWEDPFKKPSYLFALVAGDFDLIEDTFTTQSNRRILLKIFVEKGCGDQADHAMYALKAAMRWDEETYGREYDLDIYMIVAISDFNMGAMENKGLNIFNTKYVLAKPTSAADEDYIHILSVIAHEYFHNWTGNRVTCRDWFQLSLKEGLTIFRDQSFSEDSLSKTVMRIHDVKALREGQFTEDAGPLAHSVQPDSYIEINNFYTSTVYNKGAEVLRMMQTMLGKSLFRQGMDLYFDKYDGLAVTIEDFVAVMETVSGLDLTQFRAWYSQAGTPILTASGHYDENKKTYALTINQTCKPTPGQPVKVPMHIPVKMGLLDISGEAILLHLDNEAPQPEKILQLTLPSHTFYFNNITSPPIPSLLRSFSAPVKLHFPYTDNDLIFLSKHDQDLFNRHEAAQQYYLRIILDLVRACQQNEALHLPKEMINIFNALLQDKTLDLLLLAEMLSLPSEKYISEQMDVVDVDAIHIAREFTLTELSKQLSDTWRLHYQQHHETIVHITFDIETIGKRQFKNRCLYYLMQIPDADAIQLGMKQFETALTTNMTDALAALSTMTHLDFPGRKEILNKFYQTWKHDPLVVDKWFAIQASTKLPSALNEVKALFMHEAFDIKNPNKVYALLGTFCQQNRVNFHAKDGLAYVFLRDKVLQLDRLNPQIAARMVRPLTAWQRYDKEHQVFMRKQLEIIAQEKISTDLYELVTKSIPVAF